MAIDLAGINVSRETISDLETFAALVLKWTSKINLISAAAQSDIWNRHIVDSAQIYLYAPVNYRKWLDLGSGGGFPGIVAAIIAKSLSPDAGFVLIESDHRKAAFLRTVIRELKLNATVLADRIENVSIADADVISSRALGALPFLLALISGRLSANGVAILHKGRQADQEITEARKGWRFDLEERVSLTDPDGRILLIQRISRAT